MRFRTPALLAAAAKYGDKTRTAVAARTGVSISQLSRYANGRSEPTYGVLVRLGAPYGLEPDDLMDHEIKLAASR